MTDGMLHGSNKTIGSSISKCVVAQVSLSALQQGLSRRPSGTGLRCRPGCCSSGMPGKSKT